MKRQMGKIPAALFVLVLLLPACETSSGGGGVGGKPDFSQMQAALLAFDSCDEVEDYLKDVAMSEMQSSVDAYRACLDGGCSYGYGVPMRGGWEGGPTGGGEAAIDMGAQGGSGEGGGSVPAPSAPSDGNGSGASSTTGGEEPRSDTNTQEEGVDEADIVKNDGTFLYILARGTNRLRIVQAVPVEEMALSATVEIEGSPLEMFLAGDRVAVFSSLWRYDSSDWGEPGMGGGGSVGVPTPATATEPAKERPDEGGGSSGGDDQKADAPSSTPMTDGGVGDTGEPEDDFLQGLDGEILKVTVLDVSDRTNPQILRETYLEAGYVSARMVGTTVHLVGRSYPDIDYFAWYGYYDDVAPPPTVNADGGSSSGGSGGTGVAVDAGSATLPEGNDVGTGEEPPPPPDERYEEKEQPLELYGMDLDEAEAAYRAYIQGLSLEDMMPKRIDVVDGAPEPAELLIPCTTFFRPSVSMGMNIVAVFSLDLAEDSGALNATGILGSSDTVYGSADKLYVSTYIYDYWMWERNALEDPESVLQRTAIHAFDIASLPAQAFYVASGFVDGEVLNQFSMSEHDTYLRVATTTQNWFTDSTEDATDNGVTVLGVDGDALKVVGALSGLGHPGERIYAARFFGDRGFVVTFRQMDPLYTLDMSDPAHPVVAGELEIPGYSSYIHPLGADHLLTIGRDIRDVDGWQEDLGVKLAIYDVSDLAHPSEPVEPLSLGAGSHSEAEYEHKAFTFFGGTLAIPTGSWWWDGNGDTPSNGLSLFTVDATAGFGTLGTISHADLVPDPEVPEGEEMYYYCGHFLPEVHRSVFIGDRVYSISDVGVKANAVGEGLPELNAVAFPDVGGYGGSYGGECYRMPMGVEEPRGGSGDDPDGPRETEPTEPPPAS